MVAEEHHVYADFWTDNLANQVDAVGEGLEDWETRCHEERSHKRPDQ